MPYLAFNLNDGNEFVFDILEERLSIGRDTKNDIVIDNTYISAFHAEFLRQADGGYELVDLKSSNGTFVNGKRIDKSRVKGGDKIRFGQLDSRFRERTPKGTAPSAEVKPASIWKGQPARTDGRRGDTESVPIRDAVAKSETAPLEATRVPLSRSDFSGKGPSSIPVQATLIQRPTAPPDPTLQKQADELREEVAKLKQERELLRTENEKEARRREEIRALEKQVEEQRKAASEAELKLAGLKTALNATEADVSHLDKKRRDAANLENQLETTRTELEKAQADIAMAKKSLQALHSEADKINAQRGSQVKEKETLAAELKTLRQQVSEAEKKAAELKSLESRAADLTNKLDDLAATDTQLSSANETLKAVESHKVELTAAIAQMTRERDTLTRELLVAAEKGKAQNTLTQALATQRESLEKGLREIEAQKEAAIGEVSKVRHNLSQLENTLKERQRQASVLETEHRALNERIVTRRQEAHGVETRLGEVKIQIAAQESRLLVLAAEEKKLADTRAVLTLVNQKFENAQADLRRLQEEQSDCEKRLPALREEAEKLQTELTTKRTDIAAAEARASALTKQTSDLEARAKEFATLQTKLEVTRAALATAQADQEKLTAILVPLGQQREEHENLLMAHKSEIESLRAEMTTLLRDKQATSAALEKAQSDRKAAFDQTELLRHEAANLEKLLHDKRNNLETETKAKLEEATAAEARLMDLQTKISASEKRTAELTILEQRLTHAQLGVKEAEKQRLTEEQTLGALSKQQEVLRKDISKLTADTQMAAAQVVELTKKAQAEEARVADAESRLQKAQAALQAADAKRLDAENATVKARDEEKALRKNIPALNTEMAGLQAMVASLTKEREEAAQFVTRLNVATENNNKKLSELQQQISQLEEAHKVREERLMKAQEEVDKETARLKSAQDATRAAEQALLDIEKEVKESRQKADVARTQSTSLESELSTRMDRIEKLKLEETRLLKEVETQKLEVQGGSAILAEIQDKIRHEESRLHEYTHVGGKILSLAAVLTGVEARQNEAGKSLREAAERELSLQVKINSLQETLNRESIRMDQLKKERTSMEDEMAVFTAQAEKHAASLQALETEQRQRLTELETQLQDQAAYADRLKTELAALNERRDEFTQAEARMHHWKEIEDRLRGQLLELEEKHEIMRRGLPLEETTVVIFANDIIKRIDLIDALSSRYAGHSGGDVVAQLRTLRHSFEDILFQHGISEFDISPGTEVGVELRKRITVVESVPGKNKPRVVETCRSGFIYSREEGHEVILRKVEVKTSSQ